MYGRTGELTKLHKDMHDFTKSKLIRRRADVARHKILAQMKDKKLMRMRLELIAATRAKDEKEMMKIQQRMRNYLRQDMETGL